eukprot:PhF_6_TR30387/c1_g1_i5/m.44547
MLFNVVFVFLLLSPTPPGFVDAQCKSPCHPWISDDTCTRRTGKIDIRWGVTLPTKISRDGIDNITYMSYGFCAGVDEIQAFTLNYSAPIIALTGTANNTYEYVPTESRLWLFGSGDKSTQPYHMMTAPNTTEPGYYQPGPSNDSSTIVFDGLAPQCNDGPALAAMLVFNITLDKGKYSYQDGVPIGVGFAPTCDSNNYCKLDSKLMCIGQDGKMNCATCLNKKDPKDVLGKDVTIFVTYYGSDSKGKTLMSGSSNPLNFRMFSGGGAYSDMSKNMDNLENGVDDANPFKDVDSYDTDGFSNFKLSTKIPNNAQNQGP